MTFERAQGLLLILVATMVAGLQTYPLIKGTEEMNDKPLSPELREVANVEAAKFLGLDELPDVSSAGYRVDAPLCFAVYLVK